MIEIEKIYDAGGGWRWIIRLPGEESYYSRCESAIRPPLSDTERIISALCEALEKMRKA